MGANDPPNTNSPYSAGHVRLAGADKWDGDDHTALPRRAPARGLGNDPAECARGCRDAMRRSSCPHGRRESAATPSPLGVMVGRRSPGPVFANVP
jgi:hypothetical protein